MHPWWKEEKKVFAETSAVSLAGQSQPALCRPLLPGFDVAIRLCEMKTCSTTYVCRWFYFWVNISHRSQVRRSSPVYSKWDFPHLSRVELKVRNFFLNVAFQFWEEKYIKNKKLKCSCSSQEMMIAKQRSHTLLLCCFSTWPEHATIHAFGELMLPWGSN